MGDAVEIKPFSASASSGMTSWIVISAPLRSLTTSVDPRPARPCGILSRLSSEISPIRLRSMAIRALT